MLRALACIAVLAAALAAKLRTVAGPEIAKFMELEGDKFAVVSTQADVDAAEDTAAESKADADAAQQHADDLAMTAAAEKAKLDNMETFQVQIDAKVSAKAASLAKVQNDIQIASDQEDVLNSTATNAHHRLDAAKTAVNNLKNLEEEAGKELVEANVTLQMAEKKSRDLNQAADAARALAIQLARQADLKLTKEVNHDAIDAKEELQKEMNTAIKASQLATAHAKSANLTVKYSTKAASAANKQLKKVNAVLAATNAQLASVATMAGSAQALFLGSQTTADTLRAAAIKAAVDFADKVSSQTIPIIMG